MIARIFNYLKNLKPIHLIAVVMILLSYPLFACMLIVPFLPLMISVKTALVSSLFIISEVIFWLGVLILGREIVAKIKSKINPRKWMFWRNQSE